MKVVILAGGFGTRISEESHLKPKPMIEIGEKPIIWHIMKYYSSFGFEDFLILAGYKQYAIKEFFADYFLHNADVSFNLATDEMEVLNSSAENWKVTIVDTGLKTKTGGRIKQVQQYLQDESFMLTYGDGLADVDLHALQKFHESHDKIATITMVDMAQQKGVLDVNRNGSIDSFREKSDADSALINGGFMVLNPDVFDYLQKDEMFEQGPMQALAKDGQLMGFKHEGFWQCMDTQREKMYLEDIWDSGSAPWKKW